MNTLSRSLCLIKPDAVRRGLTGEIIRRIENTGLRIAGIKLVRPDRTHAEQHYAYDDIAVRHGEMVWRALTDFLSSGAVIALVVEGVAAVENMRRLCGSTEPSKAMPGTIRGDFSHHDFPWAGAAGCAIRNVIHASSSDAEAAKEIAIWFEPDEIVDYRRSDASEHLLDEPG